MKLQRIIICERTYPLTVSVRNGGRSVGMVVKCQGHVFGSQTGPGVRPGLVAGWFCDLGSDLMSASAFSSVEWG